MSDERVFDEAPNALAWPSMPDAGAAAPKTLGQILKTAREDAGMSLKELSRQIKFSHRQLAALEADDHQGFSSRVFFAGRRNELPKAIYAGPNRV